MKTPVGISLDIGSSQSHRRSGHPNVITPMRMVRMMHCPSGRSRAECLKLAYTNCWGVLVWQRRFTAMIGVRPIFVYTTHDARGRLFNNGKAMAPRYGRRTGERICRAGVLLISSKALSPSLKRITISHTHLRISVLSRPRRAQTESGGSIASSPSQSVKILVVRRCR